MGPYKFLRVEDEDLRARYFGEEGPFAEDTDTRVVFNRCNRRLLREVEKHLDWGNRVRTPFISMYSNKSVAPREAKRRVREGKKYKVYEINMRESDEPMKCCNIQLLAARLGFDIPKRA